MLTELITTVLTMTLTAYAPACGGINGSAERVSVNDNLKTVACGRKYKIGQQFIIRGIENVSLVTCDSRGGWVGNNHLDLLIFSGKGYCQEDRRKAFRIGRKRVVVEVIKNE